jgi:hypothetical protein
MELMLKDPDATLDYGVDWSSEYLSGDLLAGSDWVVDPVERDGLAVLSEESDLMAARVTVQGGVVGHIYRLTNHIRTAGGLVDSRSILLRVEKR